MSMIENQGVSITINVLKGAIQLGLGQIGFQALVLIRNVFVARLLPPEQFGIALTFVTILAALDALSELGIEIYLVRSQSSNDHQLQNVMQAMLIARGLFSSILLFIIAAPIAKMFNSVDAVWAYQTLAIIPLIRGFIHLDLRRFERALEFWPGVVGNFVSVLVGTTVSIFLAYLIRDFSAILFGSIAQVVALLFATHLLAERKYRLSLNKEHIFKLGTFGAPLILNGILIFVASQGDRVLIGSMFGVGELANYGVAAVLTGGITLLAARVTGGLFLPLLTAGGFSLQMKYRRYAACEALAAGISLSLLIVLSLLGPPIARLLYGELYSISATLFTALSAVGAIKTLRVLHQALFLAEGNTRLNLWTNLLAAGGMAAGAIAVSSGHSILSLVFCMMAGEAVSLLVSIGAVKSMKGFEHHSGAMVVLEIFALACLLLMGQYSEWFPSGTVGLLVTTVGLLAAVVLLVFFTMPRDLWSFCRLSD